MGRNRLLYRTMFQTEKTGALRHVSVSIRRHEGDTYLTLVAVCRCDEPSATCACPQFVREYDLPDATVDEVIEHVVVNLDDEQIVSTLMATAERMFTAKAPASVNVPPAQA